MPIQTEPRSGILFGWLEEEGGWADPMNDNLTRIGMFGFHLSVLTRTLDAPPVSPVVGDSYIVATGGSLDWTGLDDQVVVWTGSEWVSSEPRTGWLAYIEDEEVLTVYKASGWSTGIAM